MKRLAFVVMTVFFVCCRAGAGQISENFSSRAAYAAGAVGANEAVWNQSLGVIHPTLKVTGYNGGATQTWDVGDGSDGSFDLSTYASFSQGGNVAGNKIRLDTAAHPVLNVTNFVLDAGWTLEPVGNNPLIVKSQKDILIRGDINCAGDYGTSADHAIPGPGGAARCGGHPGGAGGAPGADGVDGTNASGGVTGGHAGNFTGGAAIGGGGGGGWNASGPAGNGANQTGVPGTAGNPVGDAEFLTIDGGAGGGGGSGTAAKAGGGGGAGGGVVLLYAGRDFELGTSPASVTGFIYVNGGDGGGSNDIGGAGGGGGGGSVKVFAARNIDIFNTTVAGASQALGGAGGTNSIAEQGGVGAAGRSWFTDVTFRANGSTGTYNPSEDVPVTPGDNVHYTVTKQSVITSTFDLMSSIPVIQAAVLTNLGGLAGDLSVEYNGSNDGFVSDSTGWQTDVTAVQGKRHLKLKFSVTSTSDTTPTMLDLATLNYQGGVQTDFAFKAAGCGRIAGPTSRPPPEFYLAIFLFVAVITRLRLKS